MEQNETKTKFSLVRCTKIVTLKIYLCFDPDFGKLTRSAINSIDNILINIFLILCSRTFNVHVPKTVRVCQRGKGRLNVRSQITYN